MINLHIRKTDRQPFDVELRLNRSETSYHKGKLDTSFIDEGLYDLFAPCFANSVTHDNHFNYYGPTKFRRDELMKLRACLSDIESHLNAIPSYESLKTFLEEDWGRKNTLNRLVEYFDMEARWSEVLEKIIETNRELIHIVSRCIREDRILWVLGI